MANNMFGINQGPRNPAIVLEGETLYVRLCDGITSVVVINDDDMTDSNRTIAARVTGTDNALGLDMHNPTKFLNAEDWEDVGTLEPEDYFEAKQKREAEEQ